MLRGRRADGTRRSAVVGPAHQAAAAADAAHQTTEVRDNLTNAVMAQGLVDTRRAGLRNLQSIRLVSRKCRDAVRQYVGGDIPISLRRVPFSGVVARLDRVPFKRMDINGGYLAGVPVLGPDQSLSGRLSLCDVNADSERIAELLERNPRLSIAVVGNQKPASPDDASVSAETPRLTSMSIDYFCKSVLH